MKLRWLFVLMVFIFVLPAPGVFAQQNQSDPVGISAEEIAEYPEPNVEQIYASDELLLDRVYRRVNGAVDIHDAPNGTLLSTLGTGFNFVTVLQESNGWSEISPGHWVRSEALTSDVPISRFAGVLLPEEPLPYPMAWTLVNVYPSLVPGGDPSETNELLLRYSKVNIYDSVEVGGWRWYQVGVDQWIQQTQLAKVIPVERPAEIDTERWISVDLYEQVAIAYEGETPVFATLVASGLPQWSTNEGLFHIYVRYPRTIMSGSEGLPDFYYLEEVPWTMYFDDDIALHGAYWHDGFGYRRSHGCVNMTITDAHWLYNWSSEEFDFTVSNDTGAAVLVYSSDTYR
ncbi:MAG: L,D-transpeptidase [bacterium]|nr:L,D-transpeptidase [bacterium]